MASKLTLADLNTKDWGVIVVVRTFKEYALSGASITSTVCTRIIDKTNFIEPSALELLKTIMEKGAIIQLRKGTTGTQASEALEYCRVALHIGLKLKLYEKI